MRNSLLLQNSLGDALIEAGAKLKELDLSDNAFGPDGVKAIKKLLMSPVCYSLEILRLNNNGLGIGGGKVGLLDSVTAFIAFSLFGE